MKIETLLNFLQVDISCYNLLDRIIIKKNENVMETQVFKISLTDRLKPEWNSDVDSYEIFLKGVYKGTTFEGEILAFIEDNDTEIPLIYLKNNTLFFNFDPLETINFIINEKYNNFARPLYTLSPHWVRKIPSPLKRTIKRFQLKSYEWSNKQSFPHWPIEESVEFLRTVIINAINIISGEKIRKNIVWGESKKTAVILTHDVDTLSGINNCEAVAKIEEKYGFLSTWYIVGELILKSKVVLNEMRDRGHEIGLHGDIHDNKIAFLSEGEIRRRLDKYINIISDYNITGFRSPSLYRSKTLFDVLPDYFLYDSSVPDTAKLSPSPGVTGSCTVFPYWLNKLFEIPITIPLDSSLIFLGYSPDEFLEIWKKKIEWIKSVGGIVVILTHSESHFIMQKEYLKKYDEFLRWISECSEMLFFKACELRNLNIYTKISL